MVKLLKGLEDKPSEGWPRRWKRPGPLKKSCQIQVRETGVQERYGHLKEREKNRTEESAK
jgi:hypothetical protein